MAAAADLLGDSGESCRTKNGQHSWVLVPSDFRFLAATGALCAPVPAFLRGGSRSRRRPAVLWPLGLLLAQCLQLIDAAPPCIASNASNASDSEATSVTVSSEVDAGGDGCDFYLLHPQFCGCCDTVNFTASDCCACQSDALDGRAAEINWTETFQTWPSKATSLVLPKRGLEGEIPSDCADRWPNLVEIDLSFNDLQGGLPPQLGRLSRLVSLSLRGNKLTGGLPPELGDLTRLKRLRLDRNSLGGGLPAELGRLSSLRALHLADTGLTGSLPMEIGRLSKLEWLHLERNALSGRIPPHIGQLSRLRSLSLHSNTLSGSLPAELGSLHQLRRLVLRTNLLTGGLPCELGGLGLLEVLDVRNNKLTGGLHERLCELSHLRELTLRNNSLSGPLPPCLGRLQNLTVLSLSANKFNGPVPAELGSLPHLRGLYLYSNSLTGSIPPELGNLSRLIHLILDVNSLTGSLPPELGRLSSLECLRLFNNRLTGPLPSELGRLSKMWLFSVSDNEISGTIPPEFGNLSSLQVLKLLGNQLTGPLPPELGRLPLVVLNAGENRLTGRLPPELGNLSRLYELNLGSNRLSGAIPAALGQLSRLQILSLFGNQLSGDLPPELGSLARLRRLWLWRNRLGGELPPELGNLSRLQQFDVNENNVQGLLPAELGRLARLQVLGIAGNNLTGGLPPSYKGLQRLKNLTASSNPGFCGSVAVLAELSHLAHLNLRGCCFQSFTALPSSIESLDLGDNRLAAVPESWKEGELTSLKKLYLDGNNISEWDTSMVLDRKVFGSNSKVYYCGWHPRRQRRLPWPELEILDLSANPIGRSTSIRDFLWSLAYLKKLSVLRASHCNLVGDIAREYERSMFVPDLAHTGNSNCGGMPDILPGFASLVQLDLADNGIVEILSDPPPSIIRADFSRNRLARLHPGWWLSEKRLTEVNVKGNPDLTLGVELEADGSCPAEGATGLTADPSSWRRHENKRSECSHLCSGKHVARFSADVAVNESVMCRCLKGQGSGLQCSNCPKDTYSAISFHSGRWQRSCLACPRHSRLPEGQQVTCFRRCLCEAGYYMGVQETNGSLRAAVGADCSRPGALGKCHRCGAFKTSSPGSLEPGDCFCNADAANGGFEGLVERRGQCGCPVGQSLNFVSRRCEDCRAAEDCRSFADSLTPPAVKAGFWALQAPAPGPDGYVAGFSHHSIWRCKNAEVCPGGSSCAANRHGPACSLCDEGFYGSPGSECQPCSQTYQTGWFVLVGVLVLCSPVPLLAHLVLEADARSRGLMLTLRSFRVSLRQVFKLAQVLGVVSFFSVEWPAPVADFFQWFRAVSMDFGSLFGVACLDSRQQQTMTLELFFRWLLPLAMGGLTWAFAFIVAIPARCFGAACGGCGPKRLSSLRPLLRLRSWEIVRLLFFFLHLFYPSLLKSGLAPLTCSPSPNGQLHMNEFPHMVCWSNENEENFWLVAIVGLAHSVFLILVVPVMLYFAWRRAALAMINSAYAERGHWGFFFEDFRPTMMRWTLIAVFRDICLNLVPVCLPGWGTAQLLLTAALSTAYGFRVCFDRPYLDSSNTVLEAWSALAVSALCCGTAGLGFQSEPEVLDISDRLLGGRDDPVYWQRTVMLLLLQGLAILGPLLVLSYQLLVAFRSTQRFVPKCLMPEDIERQSDWCEGFSNSVKSEELNHILQQMDPVEFQTFRSVIMSSVASVGVLGQFDDGRRSGLSGLAVKLDSERESKPTDSLTLTARPSQDEPSLESVNEELETNQSDEARDEEQVLADTREVDCEGAPVAQDNSAARQGPPSRAVQEEEGEDDFLDDLGCVKLSL